MGCTNIFSSNVWPTRATSSRSRQSRHARPRRAAWMRAIKNNTIDIPLSDQIEALGQRVPQMDIPRRRVRPVVRGLFLSPCRRSEGRTCSPRASPVRQWSIGGLRHLFHRALYGACRARMGSYRKSNVLTYAANLRRPLLIVSRAWCILTVPSRLLTRTTFVVGLAIRSARPAGVRNVQIDVTDVPKPVIFITVESAFTNQIGSIETFNCPILK
jgi:hypothetical protein